MRPVLKLRGLVLLLVIAVLAAACSSDDAADEPTDATMATDDAITTDPTTDPTTDDRASEAPSSEICDADGLVTAVERGAEEGTLAGMADDPVGTAAANNPVLTTLVAAVQAAGLVDTLNAADALTILAPTDCAFAQLDAATMDAAMADPGGLLTTVLGYHIIPDEQIPAEELAGPHTTFSDEQLSVDGTTVAGQAEIVVPNIRTANATVHLIDAVMIPPSAGGASAPSAGATDAAATTDSATICDPESIVRAVEGGAAEGTLQGMADDPVATAAANNPVLTTLVTAVEAAGLVDTLNSAPALTVLAPTDCAFAQVDPATLDAALADPSGLLTQLLGLHVIPDQRLASDQLAGSHANFAGSTTTVEGMAVNGQATIVVPDITTANATVHLIDGVLLPS